MQSAVVAPPIEADRRMTVTPVDPGHKPVSSEELALWRSLREERDEGARATLIERYLPYAKMVAAMMYGQRVNLEDEFADYLQMARLGLLEAIDRYDPDAGAQFKTFAARRVRGAVLDGITLLSEKHTQAHVRSRALAARTESVAQLEQAEQRGDLFKFLSEVGMGLALGFMLEDSGMFEPSSARTTGPDPHYGAIELRQTRQQLHGLIDGLPPAERKVIRHHYLHGMAFEDIADGMNLTKGRISQIHKKALATLRELMAERHTCDRSF
jgi:RNA polymerase sigma factor FliA